MPLYEYKCKECEEKFEALVSFKDADSGIKCPRCGSEKTNRLLSVFSAAVGGSGIPGVDKPCCDTPSGST